MIISINAGHTLKGTGSGAIGYLNESNETRLIANKVIKLLKDAGHTVYNDTVDYADTLVNSLKGITDKVNSKYVELFVSIHLNASNGQGNGTEVFVYDPKNAPSSAKRIVDNIAKIGFKNRGVKDGSHLYVIRNSKPKAILIEVCFCDNKKDAETYKNNIDKIAIAIAEGITDESMNNNYQDEFEKAKQFVIENGISDGTDGKENVTREQVWTMIYRAFKKIKENK